MGMGYAAAYADVIEEEGLEELVPKEWKTFKKEAEKYGFDKFARDYIMGFDLPSSKHHEHYNVLNAWKNLYKAFKEKTKLILDIGYHHSEEEGDRYDEVGGVYFSVRDMYQLSPAGKKIAKFVDRKFFVQYG